MCDLNVLQNCVPCNREANGSVGIALSHHCVNWPLRNYYHLKSSFLHSCVLLSFGLSAPTPFLTAPKTHGNGDQVSFVHCSVPSARTFSGR